MNTHLVIWAKMIQGTLFKERERDNQNLTFHNKSTSNANTKTPVHIAAPIIHQGITF